MINDYNIFKELIETLAHILEFEQDFPSSNSDRIVKSFLDDTFEKVVAQIEESTEFPDNHSFNFLWRSGKKEVVELIFRKIRSNPSQAEEHSAKENVVLALGKLYSRHKVLIHKLFDDLSQEDDIILVKLAKELSDNIRWRHSA